jgi:hypothetical protein
MTFAVREPIMPPLIPPVTMVITKKGFAGGILPSTRTSRKLVVWERKMVYNEWRAVVFESIEVVPKPRRGRYGGGAPVVGVGRDLGPAAGGGRPLPDLEKASFGTASIDKKYEITMILMGPPPIPRKADTIPSSNPMNKQKGILRIFRGRIVFFILRYSNTVRVRKISIRDWIIPISAIRGKND